LTADKRLWNVSNCFGGRNEEDSIHSRESIGNLLLLKQVQVKPRYDREFTMPVVFGYMQRRDVKTESQEQTASYGLKACKIWKRVCN